MNKETIEVLVGEPLKVHQQSEQTLEIVDSGTEQQVIDSEQVLEIYLDSPISLYPTGGNGDSYMSIQSPDTTKYNGFGVKRGFTHVQLSWIELNVPKHHKHTRILRSKQNEPKTAVVVGDTESTVFTDNILPDATYYYWLQGITYAGKTTELSEVISVDVSNDQQKILEFLGLDDVLSELNRIESLIYSSGNTIALELEELASQKLSEALKLINDTIVTVNDNMFSIEQRLGLASDEAFAVLTQQLSALVDDNNARITQINELTAQIENETGLRRAEVSRLDQAFATQDSAIATTRTELEALIETEAGKLAADILSEREASVTREEALARSIDNLSTTIEDGLNQVSADIEQERISRSNAESALASQITGLESSFQTTEAELNARINQELTTLTTSNSALAQEVTDLRTSIDTEFAIISADVSEQLRAFSDENGSFAESLLNLEANYNGLNDTVSNVNAALNQESLTRANENEALAQQNTELRTEFETYKSETNAKIETIETTQSGPDGSFAQRIDKLEADYIDLEDDLKTNTAKIQTEETARANADQSLSNRITTLRADMETDIGTAVAEAEQYALSVVGYCTIDGAISDDTTKASCEANGGVWSQLPLSEALDRVAITITKPDGTVTTGSVGTQFTAFADDLGNIKTRAFLGTDVNGRITGLVVTDDEGNESSNKIQLVGSQVEILNDETGEPFVSYDTVNNRGVIRGQLILDDGTSVSSEGDIRARDGKDGDTIYVEYQYSQNGISSWHSPMADNDVYRRERTVTNGIAGSWSSAVRIKGFDAPPKYNWIKYSPNPDGSDLTDTPNSETKFIGISYNNESPTESTNPTDYMWTKFVGDTPIKGEDYFDGKDGKDGNFVSFIYKITTKNSPAVPNGGSFDGVNEVIPNGWSDDPIYEKDKITWVAKRKYSQDNNGNWIGSPWSTPTKWYEKGEKGDAPTITTNPDGSYTISNGVDAVTVKDGENAPIPTVTNNNNGTYTIEDGSGNSIIVKDGETPIKGIDYFDGVNGDYVSFIYRSALSKPATPTGGSFDGTNEVFPNSWSDTPTNYTDPQKRWVSTRRYRHNGTSWVAAGSWSVPVVHAEKGEKGDTPTFTWNLDGSYTISNGQDSITLWDGKDAPIPTVTDNGDGTYTVNDGSGNTVLISDGKTPTKNVDYFDGNNGEFVSFIYKNATSVPSVPTGGSFDGTNEVVPNGWNDVPSEPELNEARFISSIRYKHNAVSNTWTQIGTWSQPTYSFQRGIDSAYSNLFDSPAYRNLVGHSTQATVTDTTDAFSGSKALILSSTVVNGTTSGLGNTVYVEIPNSHARTFAGQLVTISFVMKQGPNASSQVGVAYSTNKDGNSGWFKFTPTNSYSTYSFDYQVPPMTELNQDYIIINPDMTGTGKEIILDDVKVVIKGEKGDTPTFKTNPDGSYTITNGVDAITIRDGENAPIPTVTNNGNGTYTINDGSGNKITVSDGDDGYTPQKGIDYFDGLNGDFVSYVYRTSNGKPATPSGGSFNGTVETVPNSWSDSPTPYTHPQKRWVSTRRYRHNGTTWSAIGNWSTPVVHAEKGEKGDKGDQGPQGVQGPQGPDGKATYTWIRYADNANGGGISNNPTGKEYIGFAYNKTTATESNTPSDYTWSKIKGEKGNTGETGPQGPDGKPTYTWIKYSANANGSGMTDTPQENTVYIGIATNKLTPTESSNAGDYIWSRFKGEKGDTPTFTLNPDGSYSISNGTDSITIKDGKDAPIPTVTDNGDGTYTINDGKGNDVTVSDGYTPVKGVDYFDGLNGDFVSFVYRTSATKPAKPSGGSFNGSSETVPNSWSDAPTSYTAPAKRWVSTRRYRHNGTSWQVISNWTDPVVHAERGQEATQYYTWVKYAKLFYSWTGSRSWQMETTIVNAVVWTFDAPVSGKVRIRVKATDAEGKVRLAVDDTELGILSGADNTTQWYTFQTSVSAGSHDIQIWSSGADGGSVKAIEVIGSMSDLGEGATHIGYAYKKLSPTEGNSFFDYQWTEIKGKPGPGFYTIVNSNGSFPSNDQATIDFVNNFGKAPEVNDHVTYVNNAKTNSTTKRFTDSSWVEPTLVVNGDALVKGTVTTDALAAKAVSAEKIDVVDLFAQDIEATGTITGLDLRGARVEARDATTGKYALLDSGAGSPIIVNDGTRDVLRFDSNNKLILDAGLGAGTINDPSVFTKAIWDQIRMPETEGSTGGSFSGPDATGQQSLGGDRHLNKLVSEILVTPTNTAPVNVGFRFYDTYNKYHEGNPQTNTQWKVTITAQVRSSASSQWSNAITLRSSVHTGIEANQTYITDINVSETYTIDGLTLNGQCLIKVQVDNEDAFFGLHANAGNPKLTNVSAIQQVQGGGAAGAASTLDGKEGSYYLNFNNHTNIPTQAKRWPTFNEVSSKPATATRWPAWGEVTGKPTTYKPIPNSNLGDYIGLGNDLKVIEYDDSNAATGAGWSGKDAINFYGDGSISKSAVYAGHFKSLGASEVAGKLTVGGEIYALSNKRVYHEGHKPTWSEVTDKPVQATRWPTWDEMVNTNGQIGRDRVKPADILTSKGNSTGEFSTSSHLVSGRGSGGVALTINDGHGNANVTFNHLKGVPEQNGNAARIEVNTDSTTGAYFSFELGSGVTKGQSVGLTQVMYLAESLFKFKNWKVYHEGHKPTYAELGKITSGEVTFANQGLNTYDAPTFYNLTVNGYGNTHFNHGTNHDIYLTYGQEGKLYARTYNGSAYSAAYQIYHEGHKPTWDEVTGKPVQATRWPTWSEVGNIPSRITDFGDGVTSNTYEFRGQTTFKRDSGLRIWSSTNNVGAKLEFSDNSNNSYAQKGYITYYHGDGKAGSGSNDGFVISGTESNTVVRVEGRLDVGDNEVFHKGHKVVEYGEATTAQTNDANAETFIRDLSSTIAGESGLTNEWHHVINMAHRNGNGYGSQIAMSFGSNPMLRIRGANGTTFGSWAEVYTTKHKPTYSELGVISTDDVDFTNQHLSTTSDPTFRNLKVQTLDKTNSTGVFVDAGGLNKGFWEGWQFAFEGSIKEGSTIRYPRASLYWTASKQDNPTDLAFHVQAGNTGGLNSSLYLGGSNNGKVVSKSSLVVEDAATVRKRVSFANPDGTDSSGYWVGRWGDTGGTALSSWTDLYLFADQNGDGGSQCVKLKAGTSGKEFQVRNSYTYFTGEHRTTGNVACGYGSGGVAMSINDGHGNANLTFNHLKGVPEQDGNAARMVVNTDSTTGAAITFQLKSGVTKGQNIGLNEVMQLDETTMSLGGKRFVEFRDNWLRLNEFLGFPNGIYTGGSKIRTDNSLEVGNAGNSLLASTSLFKVSTPARFEHDDGVWIRPKTNTAGAKISFSDNSNTGYSQYGRITYRHQNSAFGYPSEDGFEIAGSEANTILVVRGKTYIEGYGYAKSHGSGTNTSPIMTHGDFLPDQPPAGLEGAITSPWISAGAINAKHLQVNGGINAESGKKRSFKVAPDDPRPLHFALLNDDLSVKKDIFYLEESGDAFFAGKLSKDTVDINSIQEDARKQIYPHYLGTVAGGRQQKTNVSLTSGSGVALPAVSTINGKVNINLRMAASEMYEGSSNQNYTAPDWTIELRRNNASGTVLYSERLKGSAGNVGLGNSKNPTFWEGYSFLSIEETISDTSAPSTEVYYLRVVRHGGTPTTMKVLNFEAESPAFRTNQLKSSGDIDVFWEKETGYMITTGRHWVSEDTELEITFPYAYNDVHSATISGNVKFTNGSSSTHNIYVNNLNTLGITITNGDEHDYGQYIYWQVTGRRTNSI